MHVDICAWHRRENSPPMGVFSRRQHSTQLPTTCMATNNVKQHLLDRLTPHNEMRSQLCTGSYKAVRTNVAQRVQLGDNLLAGMGIVVDNQHL